MTTPLSIIATYDELIRCSNFLVNESCEDEFLQFAINQEDMRLKWLAATEECGHMRLAVEKAQREATDLERKLSHARRLLDAEKRTHRSIEERNKLLEEQMSRARDLLFNNDEQKVNKETLEKLHFLKTAKSDKRYSKTRMKEAPDDISEVDLDQTPPSGNSYYSDSVDDLDVSMLLDQSIRRSPWKKHRPSEKSSPEESENTFKEVANLDNLDRIIATTTVVLPKNGPITASSVIETIPGNDDFNQQYESQNACERRKSDSRNQLRRNHEDDFNRTILNPESFSLLSNSISPGSDSEGTFKPSPNIGGYTLNTKPLRGHDFFGKSIIKPETCSPCGKKIRFGKVALKCRDCKSVAHPECKELVPIPCVPAGNNATLRGASGHISDYTPTIPPMVPSLIVHCVNEIELRGFGEEGLYRVNGGMLEVRNLKEKFFKGKGAPNLSEIDITTLCSTLKEFLRSLREPLITFVLWSDFVHATTIKDEQDADAILYQAISELPQPNRDTLAFLILHLQRVSSSPECKMPISNIAKIFGPTLIGYSTQSPSPISMLSEANTQVKIVEMLLKIPSDYWANFVNPESSYHDVTPQRGTSSQTPSSSRSNSSRTPARSFFTTPLSSGRSFLRRNEKFFPTPPLKNGL